MLELSPLDFTSLRSAITVLLYCWCASATGKLPSQTAVSAQQDVDVRMTARPTRPLTAQEDARLQRGLKWKPAVLPLASGKSASAVLVDAQGRTLLEFQFSWTLLPSQPLQPPKPQEPGVVIVVRPEKGATSKPLPPAKPAHAVLDADRYLLQARAVNRSTCTWMPDGTLLSKNGMFADLDASPFLSFLFNDPPWLSAGQQVNWQIRTQRRSDVVAALVLEQSPAVYRGPGAISSLEMDKPSLTRCQTSDEEKEGKLAESLKEPEAQIASASSEAQSPAEQSGSVSAVHCSGNLGYLASRLPAVPQNADLTKMRNMALGMTVQQVLDSKMGTWEQSADLADRQADSDENAREGDAKGIAQLSPETLQRLRNGDYSVVPSSSSDILGALIGAYVLADQGAITNREAARIFRSCPSSAGPQAKQSPTVKDSASNSTNTSGTNDRYRKPQSDDESRKPEPPGCDERTGIGRDCHARK